MRLPKREETFTRQKGGFNERQPAGLLQKTENVIQRVRVIISLVMTNVENKWSIKTLPFFSKLCTMSFKEGSRSLVFNFGSNVCF